MIDSNIVRSILTNGVWQGPTTDELVDSMNAIPGAVWEELTASHTTTGTYGKLVGALKSAYAWVRSA